MSIVLSHQSALRYWLTKTGDECVPGRSAVKGLAEASSRMAEVKSARLPIDYSCGQPLHVLTGSRSATWRLKSVCPHVWSGPLPDGSLHDLGNRNCVCSPELTFVQMSYGRPLVEAVEIGCYLCGCFAIGEEGRGYAGGREPLTSPDLIASFIDGMPCAYGTAAARNALKHVVADTASPMEVMLAMALSLPPALGGWAFPPIVANQRIDVDERLCALVGARHLVGDIYIPSVNGDVEYDSEEFHTGAYRLDHTQTRRNVLEAMGVRTVSATWGQVSTFERFEAFVWMTKQSLGIPLRDFTEDERRAQMDLYAHLTDPRAVLF